MTFIDVLNLVGGLSLFLYGISMMSDNLQAAAGNKMRQILKSITGTPFKGMLVGLGVTAIIQSSSATTVMLIGMVNAGIMSLQQAVGVIMGANIGTTVTAQLIAFNIGDIAYLFVTLGMLGLFFKKSRAMEHWSLIILGFGLLFVGLNVMSNSVIDLKNSVFARNILAQAADYPLLAIFAGMIFTMIIQSSSATVGIVLVLANTNLISFDGALYLVFGSNIGTTITAWLAALTSSSTSKRVALIHTLFNIIGTIIFATLTYLGYFNKLIDLITPGNVYAHQNVARHIANAHTCFNLCNTLILLPFSGILVKIAQKLIPQGPEETISMGEPKYLDYHLIDDSYLAIEQCLKEMREMLRLVRLELRTTYEAFKDKNYKKQESISRIESAIDNLQKEITKYLIAVNERTNAEIIIKKIPALLHTVNDIEKAGDLTEEANYILNELIPSRNNNLTDDLKKMIYDLYRKVMDMLELCIEYLEELKPIYTYKIIELEGRINETHSSLREQIMDCIQNGICNPVTGLHTIDFIDTMERIADKLKNLVKAGSHDFTYNHLNDKLWDINKAELDDN
ncbi:MAG TPA: Na/Pi cotransporter family protein [Candidatus Syntrophosphaera sp.]|jgi:phosphate:Na+ symporter|nr:MAG: Na+/Pi-cotransporter [Candidatus Cloacimonetes bacterium ADurb.Bin211]HOD59123.1 Na/Pi cotransporter family protein [Candidatus Syntrophosphaera sp.]HQM79166.1 Na/Pi cotransporter family protein [Candidatus Syntrophosphaera sp.]